jgi:hypothetical protein
MLLKDEDTEFYKFDSVFMELKYASKALRFLVAYSLCTKKVKETKPFVTMLQEAKQTGETPARCKTMSPLKQ